MAKRMIGGKLIDVGPLPWNVKAIGFKDADEVSRIANKFGKIVVPMNYGEIRKWFEEANH